MTNTSIFLAILSSDTCNNALPQK